MRACEKKKLYKKFCRDQVKQGLINNALGGWDRYDSNKAMHNHQRYGYRL